MLYGQLVFGPPGSGKTTYCNGMSQFMAELGRPVAIVNLDPANDTIPYTPAIDIRSLVTLEQVMAVEELGPNGGFIYCMEYLEQNLDWLDTALGRHPDAYFLFDCPGQVPHAPNLPLDPDGKQTSDGRPYPPPRDRCGNADLVVPEAVWRDPQRRLCFRPIAPPSGVADRRVLGNGGCKSSITNRHTRSPRPLANLQCEYIVHFLVPHPRNPMRTAIRRCQPSIRSCSVSVVHGFRVPRSLHHTASLPFGLHDVHPCYLLQPMSATFVVECVRVRMWAWFMPHAH